MICGKIKKKFRVHLFFFLGCGIHKCLVTSVSRFHSRLLVGCAHYFSSPLFLLSQLCKWKMRYLAKTVVVIFLLLLLFLSLLVLMIAFVSNVNICLLL